MTDWTGVPVVGSAPAGIASTAWCVHAEDFVYSLTELVHFEKRSTFVDARASNRRVGGREPDHELVWMTPHEAVAEPAHPSHRWAVVEWVRGATFDVAQLANQDR